MEDFTCPHHDDIRDCLKCEILALRADMRRLNWLESVMQDKHPDADPLFELHWMIHAERKGIRQAIDEVRNATEPK